MATQTHNNTTTVFQETYDDRIKELKQFDESKAGVKGLVDSGITTIPRFFIHPPETLSDLNQNSNQTIPTIDISGVDDSRSRRSTVVEQVSRACKELGFFQVVNHGIGLDVMDRTILAVKRFHELPSEEKSRWYRREPGSGAAFSSNFDLFFTKAASWRDTLQMKLSPVSPDPEKIPEICRNELMEWDQQAKQLAEMLMELLCEGLGVDSGRLKQLTCAESRATVAHYYPPCPQPNLTIGNVSHTDPGVITVLLQDHVGGLQVKNRGEWVDVKPIPGALVINVGDLLQIMSNGEYQSVEHRVLANSSKEPRVSVGIFCNPSNRDNLYGPFPELITPEKPAIYKQFSVTDYMRRFFSKQLDDKTLVNFYKLSNTE